MAHRFTANLSREYDTAGWTLSQPGQSVAMNLTFLAVISLLVFIVYLMLKVWKWYSDTVKAKARGDVDFGQEIEVNYGIVSPGDKHFCAVDIRSDTTSVYDTINSFRFLGPGGQPLQLDPHAYQDTVTSIKSLVLQKPETGQYDSVQSYKAFLQKVTQNKDLAVEVKLLENYPMKSKSSDHFMVVEEESSEKSENVASRLFSFLPHKGKASGAGKCGHLDKKGRPRKSSDLPPAMRKRSASNPTSRRPPRRTTSSLPSIHHAGSSDSEEEETLQSFRSDRKRLWAQRKRMCHSHSAGKMAKDLKDNSAILTDKKTEQVSKRRRHFSADGLKRPPLYQLFPGGRLGKRGLMQLTAEEPEGSSKGGKSEGEEIESSSENPPSSQSSDVEQANSEVVSFSDEEETRDITLMSTTSNRTLDNDTGSPSESELDAVFLPSPCQPGLLQSATSSESPGGERLPHPRGSEGAADQSKSSPPLYPSGSGEAADPSKSSPPPPSPGSPAIKGAQPTQSQSSSPRRVQRFHVTFVSDSADSSIQPSD